MKLRQVFGALAAMAISTAAFGQGTITSGNAVYVNNTGNVGSANWQPNGAVPTNSDEFTTNQWCFRLGAATGQMRLSMGTSTSTATGGAVGVTSQSYVGNVALLDWTSGGVNFNLNITIADGAGTEQCDLFQTMIATNTTGADITLALFHYADIDLSRNLIGGSTAFNDDTALMNGAGNSQVLTDVPTGNQLTWSAPAASAWEIRPFSSLGTAIRSATTYNLVNAGSPFGPADYTGAYQWNVVLAPGQSITFASNMSVTTIPAPGALALLGLAGLVGTRRRRA